jgi:hypothetical protein
MRWLVSSSETSSVLTIDIEKCPHEELIQCSVGDYVKFWVPRDNPEIVYVFRQGTIGGQGKLGKIPSQFTKVISNHLSQGLQCKTEILSIKGSLCTIECRLISKEETLTRRKEASKIAETRLRKELLRKYVPGEPFTIRVQLPKEHSLVEGEEVLLRNRGLDYYVENATSLEIEFTNQKNEIVASARSPSGLIRSILRASFSKIPMVFRLKEIQKPDKYTLPYLESIQAKIEVVFK